jgi:heat shock protein HslJ
MVHADLICVPQLMSDEQALAAQIGGSMRIVIKQE